MTDPAAEREQNVPLDYALVRRMVEFIVSYGSGQISINFNEGRVASVDWRGHQPWPPKPK